VNLSDAEVLVTGGGRGIGRHLVERLVSDARRVVVFERDENATSDLLRDYPAVKCYTCDVTDPEAIKAVVATMLEDGIDLDILVNNAGLIYSAPLVNMLEKSDRVHSVQTWQDVLAANLSSVFYVTGPIVDQMLKRRKKGVVISISSISAGGNPGQGAYSAAKGGVNALTRSWAKELGALGIRFAAIAPGFLDTPSTRAALSEAIITKLTQQIPLRRLGAAENVYQAVRFVVENDYVSGTVLEIDGGLVL